MTVDEFFDRLQDREVELPVESVREAVAMGLAMEAMEVAAAGVEPMRGPSAFDAILDMAGAALDATIATLKPAIELGADEVHHGMRTGNFHAFNGSTYPEHEAPIHGLPEREMECEGREM